MITERRNRGTYHHMAEEHGAGRGRSAEVILLPLKLRMQWTDLLMLDAAISPSARQVGGVIGYFLNKHRGDTYVTQDTIAGITGLSGRSVKRATAELEAAGYLLIGRQNRGVRGDGTAVAGGAGGANVYAPALDGVQVTATMDGEKLTERAALVRSRDPGVRDTSVPHSGANPALLRDMGVPQKVGTPVAIEGHQSPPGVTFDDRVRDTRVPLTLSTLPSEANPSHAPALAREAARTERRNHLGEAGVLLEARLGNAEFRAWFGEMSVVGIEGETLTLSAPSNFHKHWVETKFREVVLACFRRVSPSIATIVIVVRK